MALGRNQVLQSAGLPNQTPHLVRDIEEDRLAAVEEKIAAYKKAGIKVPDGLSRQLKKHPRSEPDLGDAAPVVDVPQPMPPGTAVQGQPLSAAPDTVPEPEDGSAPDKRAQDQQPVGFPPHAADPGPEGGKANQLPEQPQPGDRVVQPAAAEKARLAYEDKVAAGEPVSGVLVGDETHDEAEARRAVANQQIPAPDVEPRPTPEERAAAAVELGGDDENDDDENDDDEDESKQPVKKAAAKKAPAKKAAPAAQRGR